MTFTPLGPVPYISSSGGPVISVDTFLQYPTMIPERIISLAAQGFLADAIFRTSSGVQGGAVVYHESTPIYGVAGGAIEYEEWAEIPAAVGQAGQPNVARVISRGLGVKISERMRMRNDVSNVNRQITQVTNSLIKAVDDAAMNLIFNNTNIDTQAAAAAWNTSGATIIADIASAAKVVNTRTDGQGEQFDYSADTLLVNNGSPTDMLLSPDIQRLFNGNVASENPIFKGQLAGTLAGLTIMASPRVPAGKAAVINRNVLGGIADERALRATELYYEARERETWRSDVTRWSAMFVDQPGAARVITGV